MAWNYFYDAQFKRYLYMVVKAFTGIQFEYQTQAGTVKRTVPARMATSSKQVANILKNNSENTAITCPQIAIYMTGISRAPDRMSAPFLERTHHVHERKWDESTGQYTADSGNMYSVKRLNPIPYDMKINMDIWVSNEDQRHQIMEQILYIFDHAIDIQSSDNPLDWSALTLLKIEDIQWDSRSIPTSNDEDLSIATISFTIPMHLNPPAKINHSQLVHQIVMNISDGTPVDTGSGIDFVGEEFLSRVIVTLGDYKAKLTGNQIQLYSEFSTELPPDQNWYTILNKYGDFRPGVTQFRIKRSFNLDDDSLDVIGTVDVDNTNPQIMYWTVDPETLPTNDILAVDGVIDPLVTHMSSNLPTVNPGVRYIITNDITPSYAWPLFEAKTNDIIEWNGFQWVVAWNANAHENQNHFLLNRKNGKQLQWAGDHWTIALDGIYDPGYWRLYL